jgi:hypothetical protein
MKFHSTLTVTLLALVLAAALPVGQVFADEQPEPVQGTATGNQEPGTGDRIKEGASQVKDGVVEGAHAVGDAAVDGAHQVRDSATAGAQQIKQDTHGLGDKISKVATDAWYSVKNAFSGSSSQKSSDGDSK